MRDIEIKGFIDKLNNNEFKETIFLRKINELVDVAKVWEKEPELEDTWEINATSYRFFFIKNDNGKYVGAVLDMHRDLHWFILEEERKKGHLTKALREAILPYIFYDEYYERNIQRISIDFSIGEANYEASKKVATSLGFKSVLESKNIFELNVDDFDWQYENHEPKNGRISEERFLELRKKLIFSYRQLKKISDELLMVYDDDKDLGELAKEVSYFNTRIEDIEWKYNKKKN